MAYKDLQQFITKLDQAGELIYINDEVDPELEITEITNRILKSTDKNKGIVFTNVIGSPYPLCINIFGSEKRMEMALGVTNLEEIGQGINQFLNLQKYKGIINQLTSLPSLSRLYYSYPSKIRFVNAPCQQIVEEPNLNQLPILKSWPQDGGRFLTMPLVFTKDPETGSQNVGIYRMQVYDQKTTGIHWELHKDGKAIYEKYRQLGIKKMPVSVVLGSDPASIYAASTPMPKFIDEMMFSSYLRKKPVKIVKCITNDIYVPANSEFVLEGYIDIEEPYRIEGPFGDRTGYYSLTDMYPIFHIEKVTRKENPIYNATILGLPPMENYYFELATEKIFKSLFSIVVPELQNIHTPAEATTHNATLLNIKSTFPKQGSKVLNSMWGLDAMMNQKLMVVFNEEFNLQNYHLVFEKFLRNVDFSKDVLMSKGPLSVLDHASKDKYYGTRVGFDATAKEDDHLFGCDPEVLYLENLKYSTYEIDGKVVAAAIQIAKKSAIDFRTLADKIIDDPQLSKIKLIIVVDENTRVDDISQIAWRTFNNIDGSRDFIINQKQLIVDATVKLAHENGGRKWPEDTKMDEEIVGLVNRKFGTRDIF